MNIPILYEDDVFFAIDKPVGWVVNAAESVQGQTVQEWALTTYPSLYTPPADMDPVMQDFYQRAGTAHRIDKETSGILLIAKTYTAFTELQRQFKERLVKKTYIALAHGKFSTADGEINAPIGRLPWNREHFGVIPDGKEALTRYHVEQEFMHQHLKQKEWVSLVTLYPESGRTHQIRVHLKYIQHPIVGDSLYAGRKTSRDDRLWAPRVMLHAWKLTCLHPVTQLPISIVAPIPTDMASLIPPAV